MVMQAATVAVQMPREGAMPDRGENDPAQMFQQIMQQLTQGAPDTFDFTRDPKAGGMAPADTFDFTTKPTAPEPYIFKLPPDLLISSVHPSAAGTRDGGIIIDFTPGPEAESPTGRTDGVFTVVLPSVPAVQDDGLLLPAVQKDDTFDFTTEPTEPTATEAYPIKEGLFVFNRSDQVYANTGRRRLL